MSFETPGDTMEREFRVRRPPQLQFEIPYPGMMFDAFKAACISGRRVWINRPEWHGRAYVVRADVLTGSENIKAVCRVTCAPTGAPVPKNKSVPDYLYPDKQNSDDNLREKYYAGGWPVVKDGFRRYPLNLDLPINLKEDIMKVYEAIVVSVNEQGEPTAVAQSSTNVIAKTPQAAKDVVLVDFAQAQNLSGKDLSRYQVRVREFQSA